MAKVFVWVTCRHCGYSFDVSVRKGTYGKLSAKCPKCHKVTHTEYVA